MTTRKGRNFAFLLYPENLPEDWLDRLKVRVDLPMAISPLHDKDRTEPMSVGAIRKWAERQAKKYVDDHPEGAMVDGQWLTGSAYYAHMRDQFQARKTQEQQNLPPYKKPHYHVMIIANNPLTSQAIVNKIKRALGEETLSYAEIIDSVDGYWDYLTHESADAKAKNKHVYSKDDIVLLHNFDISRYRTLDKAQKEEMADKLYDYIAAHKIDNFYLLCEQIKAEGEEIGFANFQEFRDVYESHAMFLRDVINGIYQLHARSRWSSPEAGQGTSEQSE